MPGPPQPRSLPGRPNLRHLKLEAKRRLAADQVPELPGFLGPVIHASGPRGSVDLSNGGIAVLGQLLADVTGMPYAQAATRTVLEPPALSDSDFPARVTDIGQDGDVATHAGADVDATAAVTTRIRDQRTHVVLTTRMISVNSIESRLLRAWTNPT